ncbi:MAG: hypothetical protein HYR93_05945 [Chloroflexi bacterium]|nr:hypothetical protein [Chloroflexota bacterium]
MHALPFTREIAPYIAASDVVMGKAGPNMLFESIALGKPFIATAYIPGQEEVNLEFIQRHGLGWVALLTSEQGGLLKQLSASPEMLRDKKQSVENYRCTNQEATDTILPLIDSLAQ